MIWGRLEIVVDSGQNKIIQYFHGWAEKPDCRYKVPKEVFLPGVGIGMINEDFHIAGI